MKSETPPVDPTYSMLIKHKHVPVTTATIKVDQGNQLLSPVNVSHIIVSINTVNIFGKPTIILAFSRENLIIV